MKIEIHQVASDLWEVTRDGEFVSGADNLEEAEQIAAELEAEAGRVPEA
jgi:hypothetical protein